MKQYTLPVVMAVLFGGTFFFLLWAGRERAPEENFAYLCSEQAKVTRADKVTCSQIEHLFFKSQEKIQSVDLAKLGAPALPTDSKTQMVVFANPKAVAPMAYCYFQFRGWFDPKALSPKDLSYKVSGFAILKKELGGYEAWRRTPVGVDCAKRVEEFSGFAPMPLESALKDHAAMIAFNPVATMLPGKALGDIQQEAVHTFNHERIHVMQVLCPGIQAEAARAWRVTSDLEKASLARNFPSYNWNDPVVAERENLAILNEHQPNELLKFASGCF